MRLLQNNEKAQFLVCESFQFSPVSGILALNSLPPKIANILAKDPSQLHKLQQMKLLEVKDEGFMTFPQFEANDKDFMQDADLILADENCDDNERRYIFS